MRHSIGVKRGSAATCEMKMAAAKTHRGGSGVKAIHQL